MLDQRGQLLRAALGFAGLPRPSYDLSLWALRTWLDSWKGLGVIVTGMERQGYDVSLTRYPEGWRATFIRRDHMTRPWVGQVLSFHLCTRVQRQLITAVLGVSHQGEYRR